MERTSSEEEEWLLWMREKSSIITVPLSGRLRSTTRGKRLFLHSAMQACSSTGAMSDTWQTQRAAVRKEPLSDVMHLDRSKSCLSIIDLPLPAPPVTTKAAPPRSIIAACSSRYAAPVEVGMVERGGGLAQCGVVQFLVGLSQSLFRSTQVAAVLVAPKEVLEGLGLERSSGAGVRQMQSKIECWGWAMCGKRRSSVERDTAVVNCSRNHFSKVLRLVGLQAPNVQMQASSITLCTVFSHSLTEPVTCRRLAVVDTAPISLYTFSVQYAVAKEGVFGYIAKAGFYVGLSALPQQCLELLPHLYFQYLQLVVDHIHHVEDGLVDAHDGHSGGHRGVQVPQFHPLPDEQYRPS
eukprot:CAMPEP_0173207694 /NCGR_PEP_ID=MMETSP1141-20130122/22075_1 /TAXON_ID=483371 /ORGANISM="non described non described, Strain CCMP2298" /LENGTH=350 /DNA_ID=CAMNT_0014134007 /DNA_START=1758 /DNA_END=2809 /DNA_ORIENTATION=+